MTRERLSRQCQENRHCRGKFLFDQTSHIYNEQGRVLDERFNHLQEMRRWSAIHQTMVGGHRESRYLALREATVQVDGHRGYCADSEDGCFGKVNDGGERIHIVHPQVGDGECSTTQIIGQ